jgi:hypothetical protein
MTRDKAGPVHRNRTRSTLQTLCLQGLFLFNASDRTDFRTRPYLFDDLKIRTIPQP